MLDRPQDRDRSGDFQQESRDAKRSALSEQNRCALARAMSVAFFHYTQALLRWNRRHAQALGRSRPRLMPRRKRSPSLACFKIPRSSDSLTRTKPLEMKSVSARSAFFHVGQVYRAGFLRYRLAPKVFKPVQRQSRIAHRMLDIPVTQVGLKGPGIMSPVCQRKSTGMAQHMGMRGEAKLGSYTGTLDHSGEAGRGERGAALRGEHEGRLGVLLPLQAPQGTHLVAADWECGRRILLSPADGQGGVVKSGPPWPSH